MYNFDKLVDRKGTECIKWDMAEKVYGHEVLPMFIADMDFEILPELQEAMVKRASHPSFGYTAASPAYFENIIKWNKERNGLEMVKEDIIAVPGVVTAIAFALNALTKDGDKVVTTEVTVIDVGPDATKEIKAGDHVALNYYELQILPEKDEHVYGVIKDEEIKVVY